jgi:hypothetical protein
MPEIPAARHRNSTLIIADQAAITAAFDSIERSIPDRDPTRSAGAILINDLFALQCAISKVAIVVHESGIIGRIVIY